MGNDVGNAGFAGNADNASNEKPSTANAENGDTSARLDVHVGILEGALKLIHVEAVSGLAYIYKVIRHVHLPSVRIAQDVVVEIFARTDRHPPIHHA